MLDPIVGRILASVVWVSGLFVAGKACHDDAGAVQPHPARSARNQVFSAVFAHSALQVSGDSYTIPHPDPFCQMDVAVAQERAGSRHHLSEFE